MPEIESRRRVAPRRFFEDGALEVAPRLLGCLLVNDSHRGPVVIRITEVEAYLGQGEDPGSHAFRGMTKRNSSMFLPGGHLYVYRSYGIHWCANVVVGPPDRAAAVLIRAGEVVFGTELATARRTAAGVVKRPLDLARGPGRLAAALGLTQEEDSADLCGGSRVTLYLPREQDEDRRSSAVGRSTRTGVAGEGAGLPHRYFLLGEPTVSPHRPVLGEKTTKSTGN